MINYILGKLGFKHLCYMNVKKLFEHYEFGHPVYCTICKRKLRGVSEFSGKARNSFRDKGAQGIFAKKRSQMKDFIEAILFVSLLSAFFIAIVFLVEE